MCLHALSLWSLVCRVVVVVEEGARSQCHDS